MSRISTLLALVVAGTAAAQDAPEPAEHDFGEPVVWIPVLSNGDFALTVPGSERPAYWESSIGAPKVTEEWGRRELETWGEATVRQRFAVWEPWVDHVKVRGKMHSYGELIIRDGRGGQAQESFRGAPDDPHEIEFTLKLARDAIGRPLEAPLTLELSGEVVGAETGAAWWSELEILAPFPCPSEEGLRQEVADVLQALLEDLARHLDEERPFGLRERKRADVDDAAANSLDTRVNAELREKGLEGYFARRARPDRVGLLFLRSHRVTSQPEWRAIVVETAPAWLAARSATSIEAWPGVTLAFELSTFDAGSLSTTALDRVVRRFHTLMIAGGHENTLDGLANAVMRGRLARALRDPSLEVLAEIRVPSIERIGAVLSANRSTSWRNDLRYLTGIARVLCERDEPGSSEIESRFAASYPVWCDSWERFGRSESSDWRLDGHLALLGAAVVAPGQHAERARDALRERVRVNFGSGQLHGGDWTAGGVEPAGRTAVALLRALSLLCSDSDGPEARAMIASILRGARPSFVGVLVAGPDGEIATTQDAGPSMDATLDLAEALVTVLDALTP